MASVVTEFVGPRPGCYIMKFCQGATEMVSRFVIMVVSVGVLIASAVALALVLQVPMSQTNDMIISAATGLNEVTLFVNSYSAGGVGIGVAVLAIIYEIVVVILRFLNIGLINLKIKIFLAIDIIVSLVLAVVLNISGILAAYMAAEWSKVLQLEGVLVARNALIANAAFAMLDGLLVALLATWMLVFIVRKWNEEVVKETAKDLI